jgi:general secretion pathway protein N
MKLRWRWIAAIITTYLILVIAYVPAQQVLGRLSLPKNTSLHGVSGTLWTGSLARFSINNITIDNIAWDIHPLQLLFANLSLDLNAGNMRDVDAIAFKGPLTFNLLNLEQIKATDFLLFIPVDRVLAEVSLPLPVDASGRFRVNIDNLSYGPACDTMEAYGDWLNASVSGTQGPIKLGTFSAKLTCSDNNILVNVSEPNVFGLNLAATISPDFSDISVAGKFKPDADLPDEVHEAASFFGKPDADGYTSFKL